MARGLSTFNRKAGVLLGGSMLSQAIAIVSIPILTRLYSPTEFGAFAIFVSIFTIVGSISGFRYEMAIGLPKRDRHAAILVRVALTIVTLISLVTAVVLFLAKDALAMALGSPELAAYYICIPLAVWLIGAFNVLNYDALRHQRMGVIAGAATSRALVANIVQITMGYLKFGVLGLLIGNLVGGVAGLLAYLSRKPASTPLGRAANSRKISRLIACRYRDFPQFSLWSALANALSLNVINLVISTLFSVTVLGLYALVARTLGTPITLVSQSVGQAFYQEASARRSAGQPIATLFRTTLAKLALIGIVPFGIIFVFAVPLFTFIFGKEWHSAGELAQVMIPVFAIRFIVSPLSIVNAVQLENRVGLVSNLILLALSVSAVSLGAWLALPFIETMVWLSSTLCVFYLAFLCFIYSRVLTNDQALTNP